MKSAMSEAYTYKEASSFGSGFPDRGIKCHKCGTLIPQFETFGKNEISHWQTILNTKGSDAADEYLISLTGCNHRWAKIWRLHPNGPIDSTPKESSFDLTTACPFCSKPLRSKSAKQCPHCFKSWRT